MSRGIKQFLYGIFYIAIIFVISWGIYTVGIKPKPSCFDGIQNQNETGIDCGGVCGNICTASLAPVIADSISIFRLPSGNATLLATLKNINLDAGVQNLPYQFILHDANGATIGSISGNTFIYPGEIKYIASINQTLPSGTVGASVSLGDTIWTPSSSMGMAPSFAIQNLATKIVASGTVAAAGTLINQSANNLLHVVALAVFKDSFGSPIGASLTTLDNVQANTSVPFSISYPSVSGIDFSQTEIDVYAPR